MILVTGPTGNVGSSVVKYLKKKKVPFKAAVINDPDEIKKLPAKIKKVIFDFENRATYNQALENIESIFLMRPPQIEDIKNKMLPFLEKAKEKGVIYIVFLSLMGVNPMVPHYKVEKYVKKLGFKYTFLQSSYFMQNLSTTHAQIIKDKHDLLIPAGNSKTSFIDARDIGELAGILLENPDEKYINQGITLTGSEALDYYEVAEIMTRVLQKEFTYSNPSPKEFEKTMLQYDFPTDFVKIMNMLYKITRMGGGKKVTSNLEEILQRKPTTLQQFIKDYKNTWL